jgi:predicted nucleic acid-binding protein
MTALATAPFLVDSCVWIDQLRQVRTREVHLLSMALHESASVWMCGPVMQEVIGGAHDPKQAQSLREQFDAFDYAWVSDPRDFHEAAHIYRRCRAMGYTVRSAHDCLIAQICLENDLALLTSDRDFQAIAQAVPLRLL